MTWEKLVWGVATYLLIGIVVTLQNSLGKENREIMRRHNVRWYHIIQGIVIGPIGYVMWSLEKRKKLKRGSKK